MLPTNCHVVLNHPSHSEEGPAVGTKRMIAEDTQDGHQHPATHFCVLTREWTHED